MKFSIPCDQFVASLSVAARGVSTRSAIQTLSGVLVRAGDGEVELLATDM
jgi:DNA polymerase III sliding clamp (beta) subunit (PCNA family)